MKLQKVRESESQRVRRADRTLPVGPEPLQYLTF